MRTVSRDAVVEVDYRVRRRRYGDTSFLIRRNEYVETDHLTDSVWVACEQGDRLGDVIASVAERTGLPLGEATAAAVFTIERFRALGFVTYK